MARSANASDALKYHTRLLRLQQRTARPPRRPNKSCERDYKRDEPQCGATAGERSGDAEVLGAINFCGENIQKPLKKRNETREQTCSEIVFQHLFL